MRHVPLVAVLLLASVASKPASADARSRATKLFDQALALADKGRWDAACPKFRESFEAEPSVGAQLNIAKCAERGGALLSAEREYGTLLELNESTRDKERRLEVEARGREALRSLSRRIPRVVVAVSPAAAKPEILLDGRPPESVSESGAIRADPGAHVIRIVAPGFEPEEVAMKLVEGEEHALQLRLTRIPPERIGPEPSPSPDVALPGWIVGGAGLGVAAAGAALLGAASMRAADIEDLCGEGARPPRCAGSPADARRASDLASEGRSLEIGGFTLVGVGGAALATSIAMLAASATADAAPSGDVALMPYLGEQGGGAWLRIGL